MLGIELQRNGLIPLSRQVYQALRDSILKGRLTSDDVLPSTRELAKQLSVSRNTVLEAYEMLYSEGFIETSQGSPSRVVRGLLLEQRSLSLKPIEKTIDNSIKYQADFKTGLPDISKFPKRFWLQLQSKASEAMQTELWGYSGPEGLPVLREQIAGWLFRRRGISVNPKDIFITAGATQALHLLSGLFKKEDREIIIEDPCHIGMFRVLQESGYNIHPTPVDEHGLRTELLKANGASAIYVTPSHQFPLGGVLSAGRRAALIRFARENKMYILEDDYDSEFRYSGSPVSPLYSMDPNRVIYIGTFSKILFPALRIGYIILPAQLQSKWRQIRTYSDVQNPPFEQAALAEFLRLGKLDRYVQKMRRIYGFRRQLLLNSLEEVFGSIPQPWGDSAGLHIALQFPGMCFGSDFFRLEKEYGIRAVPVEYHSIIKGFHQDKLLLGYGHMSEEEIRKGILLLHKFISTFGYKE